MITIIMITMIMMMRTMITMITKLVMIVMTISINDENNCCINSIRHLCHMFLVSTSDMLPGLYPDS